MKFGDIVKVLFLGDVEPDITKLWAGRTCEIVAVNENSYFILDGELGRYEVFADEIELCEDMTVANIPHTWSLIQNEDDVRSMSEELGCEDDNYTYLWVVINEDGGIDIAYGGYSVDIERSVYLIRRDY